MNQIEREIDRLYVERSVAVRAGEGLRTWHGEERLVALEQEAADRIPDWCTPERRDMVPPPGSVVRASSAPSHGGGARPIYEPVPGAPWQPGDIVRVVAIADDAASPEHIGKTGRVTYLEYSCGCGQSYPDDPMIGVELAGGKVEEFWREELAREGERI